MSKFVAIGDIHGRHDLLTRLLAAVTSQYPTHRLLFLGDYVDRFPDSAKVIKTLRELHQKGAIVLQGNHEVMMIDYAMHPNPYDLWLMNGGHATIRSYNDETKLYGTRGFLEASREDRLWLSCRPLYYEDDEIFASHAPMRKEDGEKDNWRRDMDILTWTYFEPQFEGKVEFDHGKLALCGHIHALRQDVLVPRVFDKIIYCDTGCGCAQWGPLSGVVIEEGVYKGFLQVDDGSPNPNRREA